MVNQKIGHVFSSLEIREYSVIGKISRHVAVDFALGVQEKIDSKSFCARDWHDLEGLIVLIVNGYFRAIYKIDKEYFFIILYG